MAILLASATQTASGNSAVSITHGERMKGAIFLLTVSAAGTAVGDLLDVYIQSSPDGGTTYDDFVRFTQVLGNGGAKKFTATWMRDISPTSSLHAPADATMTAGVNQGPIGSTLRVKWVITSSVTPSFTFKIDVSPINGK